MNAVKKIIHIIFGKTKLGIALANGSPYLIKVMNLEFSNNYLFDQISNNIIFQCNRYGISELGGVINQIAKERIPTYKYPDYCNRYLSFNAGMFTTNYIGRHYFKKVTIKSIKGCDAHCVFPELPSQNYLIGKYGNKKQLVLDRKVLFMDQLLFCSKPWPLALKGKKVLVISVFDTEIKAQYEKKDLLFKKNILPDFRLITYKPIMSFANEECGYSTWKKALYKMFDDIKKIDFDIALLSCGAYGAPLQHLIKKKLKKSSIYIGGAINRMFGIKSKRDVDSGVGKMLYNENWIDPSDKSRPIRYKEVEDGCYW